MENVNVLSQPGRMPEEYKHNEASATGGTAAPVFVHRMVSAQAARDPESIAVVSREVLLSFGELDQRANVLAQHFRSLGVGRGTVVALWLRRSHWIMISSLAALKAGAAYLPLDPESPADRLRFMV